jgi:molybdopterin-guanine dinucleotide biosynthesis protein A
MPFLNPALLGYLISLRKGKDAVVPLVGGHPQGLHALYGKACLATMRHQLEQKNLKIRDFCIEVNTCWLDEETLHRYDNDLASFVNINTPEALQAAADQQKDPPK